MGRAHVFVVVRLQSRSKPQLYRIIENSFPATSLSSHIRDGGAVLYILTCESFGNGSGIYCTKMFGFVHDRPGGVGSINTWDDGLRYSSIACIRTNTPVAKAESTDHRPARTREHPVKRSCSPQPLGFRSVPSCSTARILGRAETCNLCRGRKCCSCGWPRFGRRSPSAS